MTIEALAYIEQALTSAGVNYEFGNWSSSPIPHTYFTGEFVEVEPLNEDGCIDSNVMLTGVTDNSWLELMEAKEKIEELFPSVDGKVVQLEKSCVAIFYCNTLDIPTNESDIKRIQINLKVKEWKVK